jgi:hypothetical protein
MRAHFLNNRILIILIQLVLMVSVSTSSCSQDTGNAAKKGQEPSKALTADQAQQIKTILSGYNPSTLTPDIAKEIHEKFRAAGIHPGPDTKDAIIAAGFDPEKLRTLAPPPDKSGKEGKNPPSVDERLKMLEEKVIKPLGLTDTQNGTIKNAYIVFFTEMDKLRAPADDKQAPPDRSKVEPLEKARDEKIHKVLTDDQFSKYHELEKASRPPKPNANEVR